MKNLYDRIEETASYIKAKTDIKPTIGLILGSGLGVLADEIENCRNVLRLYSYWATGGACVNNSGSI